MVNLAYLAVLVAQVTAFALNVSRPGSQYDNRTIDIFTTGEYTGFITVDSGDAVDFTLGADLVLLANGKSAYFDEDFYLVADGLNSSTNWGLEDGLLLYNGQPGFIVCPDQGYRIASPGPGVQLPCEKPVDVNLAVVLDTSTAQAPTDVTVTIMASNKTATISTNQSYYSPITFNKYTILNGTALLNKTSTRTFANNAGQDFYSPLTGLFLIIYSLF